MKAGKVLSIAGGVVLALLATRVSADAAAPSPLTPSLHVPPLTSVSADDYYPLLLQWTQTLNSGHTALQVTYLDPRIIVAQIKSQYATRAAQEAAVHRELDSFPRTLWVQVTYATPNRSNLHPEAWHAVLVGSAGAAAQGRAAVTAAPSYQSGAASANWEETVRYTFANSHGQFLSPGTTALQVRLSGPQGTVTATWSFVASAVPASASPTAYVRYLGGALLLVCAACAVALWWTRPPKELLA
jgi:hypothetical protein